jgi:predicted metal-binding protein
MKIAIIVQKDILTTCSTKGCLNAFNMKLGAFERYGENTELVELTSDGVNMEDKIQNLIRNGVEAVHLSTCMRARSNEYELLAERLSKHFHVIGYTHGSEQGKTKKAVNIKRIGS